MLRAVVLATAALLMSAGSVHAQTATAKCSAAKIKCANGKATALLKCHNKAEGKNLPVDPACISKAELKFSDPVTGKGCMEKAESKPPCSTTGDAGAIEAKIDAFVLDVVTELDPGYPTPVLNKCSAGKKKCVGNKVKALLGCYGKDVTKPDPVKFMACIQKGHAKFDGGADPTKGCFAKLEAKGSCLTTGDTAALESKVDAFATDVNGELAVAPPPTLLDFAVTAPGGACGAARDGSSAVVKVLSCGGLNLGAGGSIVPEGPTPDGSQSQFSLFGCGNTMCNIGPTSTVPPVNTADFDCTDTGCNFGTPLPIPNPVIPTITTCVLNTWAGPASGTLDLTTGESSTNVPLNSDVYLTGNLAQPCPVCSVGGSPSVPGHGTCDRGPRAGMTCTSTSSTGVTRDCPTGGTDGTHPCTPGGGACIDGSHVGVILVDLSPLTTGTSTLASNGAGQFCPGQLATHPGCFGQPTCRSISETGSPTGPVFTGVPGGGTLASVFCIAATGNGLVDASADLPGPGAVSLPGRFLAHN